MALLTNYVIHRKHEIYLPKKIKTAITRDHAKNSRIDDQAHIYWQ